MAFEAITTLEILAGKFAKTRLFQKIKNSLDFLNGEIASQVKTNYIPNSSFELDADGDGLPDRWTRNLYPGGNGYRDVDNAVQGVACLAMVHPGGAGNGGAYFDSDYIPCSPLETVFLGLAHWATAAGMHNRVDLLFFDKDKVTINADQTVYDSTTNPTTPTAFLVGYAPPAEARFMKIRLVGGMTDTDVAGTAYFDALNLAPFYAGIPKAAIQDFTIAEAMLTGTDVWTEAGSPGTITPHVRGLPMTITFSAELRGGTSYTDTEGNTTRYPVRQRFKIGSNYSQEREVVNYYYTTENFTIVVPAGTTGDLTIQMELYRESSAGTEAYGRALSPGTQIRANI